MPNQYIFDNKTTAQTIADNEQMLIDKTGSVFVTGAGENAIKATGSSNTINLRGTAYSTGGIAVQMGFSTAVDNYLHIEDNGYGQKGYVNGAGGFYAVAMFGNHSVVENEGTIWNRSSNGAGVVFSGNDPTKTSTLDNSGTIDVANVAFNYAQLGAINIVNSGLIRGSESIAVNTFTGGGVIHVANSGQLVGDVNFGAAADILDTRLGTLVGIAHAGAGNDLLQGSKLNDNFFGDADNDSLYGFDGNDMLDGGDGNDTVYGGNGNDTATGGLGDDKIFGEAGNDMLDGGDGKDAIYGGLGNDTINGGLGDDLIYGDAGNDVIDGGDGADRIFGGLGIDSLHGGLGKDLFVFKAKETGTTTKTADTIDDFDKSLTGDRIDLSYIDASTKHAGDDKFSFIGKTAFHGTAGELRFERLASDTYIYGDVNGDKKADFVIHLDDAVTMTAAHFVL